METVVRSIESAALFEDAVADAVRLLRSGALVALPTETVYGLAANALDPRAVEAIYRVKGRPAHNPIIVHVSSVAMARRCVAHWPDAADKLAGHFWPGPLTVVLPKDPSIPDIVSAGGKSVGVRLPLHPLIRSVIERCGFPLAAPSANRSNQLSSTTAEHVAQSLGGEIPLVVDAGPTSVGIESTVVDLSGRGAVVLRPGMISASQIEAVLGTTVPFVASGDLAELKSPGRLAKHYSPRSRLQLCSWRDEEELQSIARRSAVHLHAIHVLAHEQIPQANPFGRVAIIPHDPEAYARAIYAELHRSDQLGAELILVETPPSGSEWEGIRDRLIRASSEE